MRPFYLIVTSAALLLTMSVAEAGPVSGPSAALVVRADKPYRVPGPADYKVQYATDPQGHTLGINERYLTLDGNPWLPVMGEFHYTRVPESQWDEEILKMKAAGVQIVSTYVFWIHHEEIEGQFDWSGRRDLRRFVEICARHGMYVWLRIGPWDHGEVRNGGFPDWLLKKVSAQYLRRDDPLFLGYVNKLYAAIAGQAKGLLWDEGGPIIGVQLENEYSLRGSGAGQPYILALKKLALSNGFRVPFYSVTGWDNAVVPKGAVVAVFGGYPDAPWDASLHQLPPEEVYEFRFGSRVSGNMGAIGANHKTQETESNGYPFMTAEMGGGVQDTYHRRPVIDADDVAAMMPVMLGSGVNLYGTYMFQGGINPNGKLTTLQESQVTGYPNDLPIKTYDFQAPLSAFGQERESFRKLKIFN
ncbi:MAG TPA: beta-galactosidase, partial [Acidobacteriaceae bacterium]|nr:beta-galactosidase [Acidobacteriaceae bacterium]